MPASNELPPMAQPYREFELNGWEAAAPRYAASFERATTPFIDPLLDGLEVERDIRLLDLACGTGRLTAAAMQRGAQVVGVDFAANMLMLARANGVPLVRGDAECLPFVDRSFDAVAINFGVHHFPYPLRAVADARRVLRPRGRLGFTIWESPDVHPVQKIVFDAIRVTGSATPALPPPPGGGVTDAEACHRLLHLAGFADDCIHITPVQQPLRFETGRALIDMLRRGTVQTAAVIEAQPDFEALVQAVEREIERYRAEEGYVVPARALLARAWL